MINTMKTIPIAIGILLFSQNVMAQFYYGDYSVRVEVEGNAFAHFTEVYFEDGLNPVQSEPTYGWDGCCDALLTMGNPWQPHVFTQVVSPGTPPANNHRLSINGLPHVYEHTIVPLGFLPGELASYDFTFEELFRLPPGMTVELEDLSLNITQDLLLDSTYSTWGAVSDDEERFAIHFYPENITSIRMDEQPDAHVWVGSEKVVVGNLSVKQYQNIALYDMLGRMVWEDEIKPGENEISISISGLHAGVYILDITSEKGTRKTVKISL